MTPINRRELCLGFAGAALSAGCASAPAAAAMQPARTAGKRLPRLRVSENRRFLVRAGGAPFFYLGDTAWELFHRLNREDADLYLRDRSAKRFSVIQAVALAEFSGLTEPNPYGALPLQNNDPTRPNEAYWQHVDWTVDRANELDLYVGMLPSWGDKVNKKWGEGPEIFTPENAAVYGEWLGRRYRDRGIIWIVGGDRPVEAPRHAEAWRNLAGGLRKGDGGAHLITFHPMGGRSSAEWFHGEPWLDFNMLQSGHGSKEFRNYEMIARDYAREPAKPCVDGEAPYEDHPINWKPENGWFDDWDIRRGAYWAVFAGALGHTYGCHDIWQFLSEKRKPVSSARTPWREAIRLPGSAQVQHVRALVESRPYLIRVPDPSLLVSDLGNGLDNLQATRGSDGSYAFVYSPTGKPVQVHRGKLSGEELAAWWYDPRQGTARRIESIPSGNEPAFTPPSSGMGNDWVLVLDDVARKFPAPGRAR
jgi:hypothetical protein